MQEISREDYIKNIYDYEKLYLILVEDGKVFLRVDIENGEDERSARIEIMYFEMDTSLNFLESNLDSRNCGRSIYFIEYNTDEEAEKNVLKDFLDIEEEAVYLVCSENDLKNILREYDNEVIYVITQ